MKETRTRYVVTVDMYVYGEDDYMARKNAHKMLDEIDEKNPNARPEITEMGIQPFASYDYIKLDDWSKPIPKVKDKPLPF
jgi:hypothetical protein